MLKKMTLKKKLILLLSVLFLVIITSIGLSGYFVNRLAENSREIVNDNYRSLVYVKEMQQVLDKMLAAIDQPTAINPEIEDFQTLLGQQAANITETGEATLTEKLAAHFREIRQQLNDAATQPNRYDPDALRQPIFDAKDILNTIFQLNEKAVEVRNQNAAKAADDAILYSSLFALTAILVTLFYIFRIPGYLVKPIKEIRKQMQQVSERNYNVSVNENRNDEFKEMAFSFNKMTKRLQKFEQSNIAKVMIERNRLNAVVEQFDIPILGISEANTILFANDRMLEIIQQKKDTIIGENLDRLTERNELLQVLVNQHIVESDRNLVRIVIDGTERLFAKRIMTTATELSNSDALAHDRIVILDDVTDFIQKDVRKTQFMATLSHELKTPVAAIEMSTDLLSSKKVGKLNIEQREYVEKINEQASRIRRMVNEVLDLSKIESGTTDFELENTDVLFIIEEALQTVEPFLKQKNIQIEKQIEERLPKIHIDGHKVLWTLNNFLTNALRYTPEGGKIKVLAYRKNDQIRLAIKDYGPGIAAQDQQRIFQKYVRLNKNEKGGTGLGLAISKEFIEAMEGKIGVHSKENEGATFWIQLNPAKS